MATPTFLLVPALGSDAAVWRRTIAALDGQVERIVGNTLERRELRGHGRDDPRQALDRFVLAGVSMGGRVAMEIMRVASHRALTLS